MPSPHRSPGHLPTPRRLAAALTLLAALTVAACTGTEEGAASPAPEAGDTNATASTAASPGAPPPSGSGSFPVSVAADNGAVEVPARPGRIVSLSATATESLFAIGAGEQVEAVDDQSNYPPEAPTSSLSGFTPNAEAIIGYDPDLVVASDDQGGLVDRLGSAGIPVLLLGSATDLDGAYEQIRALGAATGHGPEAAALVEDMDTRLAEVVAATPVPDPPVTVFHELSPDLYSATSATFIGSIYDQLGMDNVADAAAVAGNDYPQLSAEAVVAADPDLVVLADTKCCAQSAATVAARPGWDAIAAVRAGAVVTVDDDIASRWGPRVVDFAELVSARVQELAAVPVP